MIEISRDFFHAELGENNYISMEGTCWAIDGGLYHHPHHTLPMLSHAHFLPRGDFWKNRIDIGQKSILTKVGHPVQAAQNRSWGVL